MIYILEEGRIMTEDSFNTKDSMMLCSKYSNLVHDDNK